MTTDVELVPKDDDDAPRIRWTVVIAAFTALAVLRFNTFFLDDITRARPETLIPRLIEESTGAYGAMLLFPLIVVIERRFPLSRGRWRRNWLAHLGAFIAFSAAHTSLLAISRAAIFPLLGQGLYDYGRMPVRYFMEASTDILAYAIFVGVLTGIRVQRYLRGRELREAALERDAATAQLRALSLQLQPHFLFNALNTISSTVYDDPVAADELIGRLGDLLRHALRTTERQEVTVSEELDTLRAYLAFVDARFGDRVRVALEVDPATHDLAIPAFLLQPLVENAVQHGATREYGASRIRVAVERRDAALEIHIDNDVDAERDEPRQFGTGLGTTHDRLRLLYGAAAALSTSVSNGQFSVRVRLPARVPEPAPPASRLEEHAGAHR
jgi:two-component sensor histidine kinase